MFSFQFHNQVLYHLTQLTSALNPKPISFQAQRRRHNGFKKIPEEKTCTASTNTERSQIVDLPVDKLTVHDVIAALDTAKSSIWVRLDKHADRIPEGNLKENRWRSVSYVSGSNFTENKNHFPCTELTEPIILPLLYLSSTQTNRRGFCTVCRNHPCNYRVQIRSFKTKHSIKADMDAKSSFMSKFKNWFLPFSRIGEKDKNQMLVSDFNKVKSMFSKDGLSSEYHDKVKAVFIEGYEAGLQRQIQGQSMWPKILTNFLILALASLILLYAVISGGIFRFTLDNSKGEIKPETINVTFNDVKGIDEAMEELQNIVQFLKNPDKFSTLGGKLPKGVLLVGPPGTGKTLLARAIAGEAGVPFFHAAGPEFDEILVGQGARRVRDLFRAAKSKAPAVIFLDEIDSVGATRTSSLFHPYANQTINQLLAEMDGFMQNDGVIVLGATNRRDDLDKALIRPGRFDVQVYLHPPDIAGRKEIFNLYLSRVLTRNIDVDYLARCTSGFTGADLENMVNQAALKAAMDDDKYITMEHLEYAKDKVKIGPERKVKSMDEHSKLVTAYHEAGHTLVAHFTKHASPIHKVSIIPRGHTLGHTQLIDLDKYHTTKSELLASMDTMMGGRAAEELIFGSDNVTTGAYSDLKQATMIAEHMVKLYGMSEKVGLRCRSQSNSQSKDDNDCGPETSETIEREVKRLLQESYDRAKALLKNHMKQHKRLAEALLKFETLNAQEIKAIINGEKPRIETLSNPSPVVDPTEHVL